MGSRIRSTGSRVAVVAMMSLSLLVATIAPAHAADVTERHQQCDMTAHQVTKNNGYATASGSVYCDSRRAIELKVILQVQAADGKWYKSKASTLFVRDSFSSYHSVTSNCSRAERPYRTRIEVKIDGGQVWGVVSSGATLCKAQ